jgi:two-component system, chemotaxis family, chemotaxis protein CheY
LALKRNELVGDFQHRGGAIEPPLEKHQTFLVRKLLKVLLVACITIRHRLCVLSLCNANISPLFTKEVTMSEFKSGFFVGGESTNGRVLIVDDEPDIRKVVRMTLQKAGYDVLEAENGEKAIEVINSGENRLLLDVIICDIRMPKVNGIEAIAYFRQNYPRVPLIVLTGFPDTDMATSLLRQGVVDYLVKPVEGDKLKASVARAMEQRELAHL